MTTASVARSDVAILVTYTFLQANRRATRSRRIDILMANTPIDNTEGNTMYVRSITSQRRDSDVIRPRYLH